MQRMGDIILSFPLFLWMRRNVPDRPIWVVAEPGFYTDLLDVSPPAVYLPWTATHELYARDYQLIINLSHRPEAAKLAGELGAGLRFGPVRDESGLRVHGRWQLYRAALTHNNRHNRFHWAELNALDCVDPGVFPATSFDTPRLEGERGEAVGLFVGASQDEKRPGAAFWAQLARELERRGLKVVLLGGPGDVPLCGEVKKLHGGGLVDVCGKLGLREFMAVGQTLTMMITPDTGPMHLAAWSGLMTLNLSMGPVNPWETGPYPPGHYVLRAGMSCVDCWRCRFERPFCHDRFDPAQVAYLAWKLSGGRAPSRLASPPGTRLYRTGRTPEGFYDLVPVGQRGRRASDLVGEFWRGMFGASLGLWDDGRPRRTWKELAHFQPALARAFSGAGVALAGRIKKALLSGSARGEEFWAASPPMLRPLAGYMHMLLENADFSREALAACLSLMERFVSVTASAPGQQDRFGSSRGRQGKKLP